MKNLFKNLMLVAVAAMAFTACTETNDEVNAVSKKTVIKGVATIDNNGDDTRSAFGDRVEDENGNFYYESNWEGGESIHLYFSAGFSDDAEVDAAGNFEIEYIGDLDPGTTVTICSPYYAWDSVGTFVIPSEQTPLKNSVDPLVHILKSEPTEIVDNTISATMKHVAAYGKMTINAPEEFEISKVEVSFNGGQAYTLDATNVDNNVFWFTTTPMGVVNEFTVTAYDAQNKAITKTVDVDAVAAVKPEKALAFNTGRVSAFSVSGLKEVEVKDSAMATLVTDTTLNGFNPYDVTFSFKDGNKVVVRFNTGGEEYLHLGNWQSNDYKQPHYISQVKYNGEYAAISACNVAYENDAYKVTLTVNATNYTFTGAIQGLKAPEACDCLEEPDPEDTAGTGTESDPYKLTLKAMTKNGYVSYDFETANGILFHLETNWTKATQAGNYTFAGGSDPIPAQYCAVNNQFGSSVGQGGYVNFSQNGETWRIDMHVPYTGGAFYAYYEGPLDR